MSEEEEMLGADFTEHGIEKCVNSDGRTEHHKDIGIQYSPRLSFWEKQMENEVKKPSTYCNKGILNFGYLSISERLTSKIIKADNEKNKERSKDIDKVK